ncbi:ankyrin [Melanomma pulvis-pyrius CBS 109.77]|uniref:Ankyrin n=1 Tax=Melanomma pulvis-pyrius CBS 109.77 TaxID=1314802 RepID=A0A6A6XLQ3_9PLEO|nr:ankyrin [Melanomma pulvis-pyrius CBS 109.77]
MDPLSISASIITVISAAGAVLKRMEDIRARSNPHAEILTVMNMVTDLQSTLIVVRDCEEALRNSKIPETQRGYQVLPETISKAQKSLDRLVHFSYEKMLRNGKGMARLGLTEKKRRQLFEIKQSIDESHRNLRLVLLSANLHHTPVLLSAIHDVSIVQRDHVVKTSATLEQIITQITTMQAINISESGGNDLDVDTSAETFTSPTKTDKAKISQKRDDVYLTSQLCITTSMPQRGCAGTCNCQCHIRSQFRTPQWLSAIVGTLFYSSSYNPSPEVRPCNSLKCVRSRPSSSSYFTYYFPTWMIRSALVFSTWNNLDGRNSSWVFKMPNEIDSVNVCWYYIRRNSIEKIRGLLKKRSMTPYDMRSDGTTVLHFALFYSIEICELLVIAGADWHFKNRCGRSPSDYAWHTILRSNSTNDVAKSLRNMIDLEDSHDLCLNPLHRIIVDLSGADLRTQLELDPARIDERDGLGMTPLMWAASRGDYANLQILLSHNASINLRDMQNKSVMHYAASSASLGCIKALLDANVDHSVEDEYGNTPLHGISYSYASPLAIRGCILALQGQGADIEARNKNGNTPLMEATLTESIGVIDALLQCDADVNAIDPHDISIIARAISSNVSEVLQLLCRRETKSSWVTKSHHLNNVLKVAGAFGNVRMIKIIANSDISPVECNIEEVWYWYKKIRGEVYWVERCSPEEELAAFEYLLEKKWRPVDEMEGQIEDLEDTLGDQVALVEFDDRCSDAETGSFEDAMEDLPSFCWKRMERVEWIHGETFMHVRPKERPKRKVHTLATRNRDPSPRTIRIPEEPHSLLVVDDLRRLNVIIAEPRVAAVSEAACGAGSVAAVGRRVGVDERARCEGGEEEGEEREMHGGRSRRGVYKTDFCS